MGCPPVQVFRGCVSLRMSVDIQAKGDPWGLGPALSAGVWGCVSLRMSVDIQAKGAPWGLGPALSAGVWGCV